MPSSHNLLTPTKGLTRGQQEGEDRSAESPWWWKTFWTHVTQWPQILVSLRGKINWKWPQIMVIMYNLMPAQRSHELNHRVTRQVWQGGIKAAFGWFSWFTVTPVLCTWLSVESGTLLRDLWVCSFLLHKFHIINHAFNYNSIHFCCCCFCRPLGITSCITKLLKMWGGGKISLNKVFIQSVATANTAAITYGIVKMGHLYSDVELGRVSDML